MQGHFIGYISPEAYVPILTFQVWAMLIVGGSGNNRGAILGAIVVWAFWASSGALIAAVVPPEEQARRISPQNCHDRSCHMPGAAAATTRLARRIENSFTTHRRRQGCHIMTKEKSNLPHSQLPGGLSIPRILCGLWQVADIERSGIAIDPATWRRCFAGLCECRDSRRFDMADHYGTAELITANLLRRYSEKAEAPRLHQMVPRTRSP